VRIVVTEVTGQGSIRRGVLDTTDCGDADRCNDLIGRAALDVPPPYRPVPRRPVYHIRADDNIVLIARRDLAGPLLELVTTTLAGEHPRTAQGTASEPAAGGPLAHHGQRLAVTQPARGKQPGAPDVPGPQRSQDVVMQDAQAGGRSSGPAAPGEGLQSQPQGLPAAMPEPVGPEGSLP